VSFKSYEKFSSIAQAEIEFRSMLHTYLLYGGESTYTPLASSLPILLPEEVPIWIAFFHMSSIVRYRPEYLAKLFDDKSWPVLHGLSRHGIFRYLNLTLNFAHQTTYSINSFNFGSQ